MMVRAEIREPGMKMNNTTNQSWMQDRIFAWVQLILEQVQNLSLKDKEGCLLADDKGAVNRANTEID